MCTWILLQHAFLCTSCMHSHILLPSWLYHRQQPVSCWLLLYNPVLQHLLLIGLLLPFRYDCPAAVPCLLVLHDPILQHLLRIRLLLPS